MHTVSVHDMVQDNGHLNPVCIMKESYLFQNMSWLSQGKNYEKEKFSII